MISPRKQDRYDGSRKNPPFFPSPAQNQSKDEKEDGYGTHIHRTGGKRLRTPVERHMPEGLAKVRLTSSFEKLSGLGIHVKRAG